MSHCGALRILWVERLIRRQRHNDVSGSISDSPLKPVNVSSDPNTTWVWNVVTAFDVSFRHQINSHSQGLVCFFCFRHSWYITEPYTSIHSFSRFSPSIQHLLVGHLFRLTFGVLLVVIHNYYYKIYIFFYRCSQLQI